MTRGPAPAAIAGEAGVGRKPLARVNGGVVEAEVVRPTGHVAHRDQPADAAGTLKARSLTVGALMAAGQVQVLHVLVHARILERFALQ